MDPQGFENSLGHGSRAPSVILRQWIQVARNKYLRRILILISSFLQEGYKYLSRTLIMIISLDTTFMLS